MQFTDERVEDGDVRRYSFNLTVAGDTVPAVLWAPNGAKGAWPLVLMGHGGSQHKRHRHRRARSPVCKPSRLRDACDRCAGPR